jgi:hypothetical protein
MTTALEATEKDFEQMMQMLTGSWVMQIAGAVATYSIADHLAKGPATAEQISTTPISICSNMFYMIGRWRSGTDP